MLKEYEDTQVLLCIVKLSEANILYFLLNGCNNSTSLQNFRTDEFISMHQLSAKNESR